MQQVWYLFTISARLTVENNGKSLRDKGGNMISALDDILEDFSLYLRVEKRISEGVARNLLLLCEKVCEVDR